MRAITKGPEPPSLTAHRRTVYSDYDNYADKEGLRHALVTEQRGLCCYCMSRIYDKPTAMKIEHWRSQSAHAQQFIGGRRNRARRRRRWSPSDHAGQQLEYRNLLAACRGGDGQPRHLQHCDTRKGDQSLRWNPADPSHSIESRIHYGADGSIGSTDEEFARQLEEVLNLNLPFLRNNRKGLLDAVLEWWHLEQNRLKGPVPRARFEAKRDRHIGGVGDLEPYCQVAVWWLEQRLKRMQA